MKKTVVFLADGFEECEGLIVVDLLRRAGIEVIMASIMGRLAVVSSRGIKIVADALAEQVDFSLADMVVLPGGRIGTEQLRKNETVRECCRLFAKEKSVGAICAAPSILAELGLLEGKTAVCHPDYADKMDGAVAADAGVAIDGNIITAKGLGTAFPFAFALIRFLSSEKEADRISKAICYE